MPYLLVMAIVALTILSPVAGAVAQSNDDAAEPLKRSGVRVTERGTVELHLVGQPIADVLHLLSLEGRRNIIASPDVHGFVTANLYDVTFEQALEAILVPNNAGFRTQGHFIFVYTNDELADMATQEEPTLVTDVFRLDYTNASDVATVIKPMLGQSESIAAAPQSETGLTSDATHGGGDHYANQEFVIVTAYRSKMRQIADLIQRIDLRPQQVLIEATILRAELDEANALGIDFTIVGGVDLELLGASSNAIQDLALGQLPQERFELFNTIGTTSFTDNVPGGGLTFGIIKDHVAVFLRALEQVTDTTVLANPKVLALNKQKGQVIVGRRDGYLTTTVTETQTVQTVEFLETGTQLIFRPFIGKDGFVRMELHPEDSVGFVNAQGLPSKQTTEVTTNVVVRDGQTILIGGLFREVTSNTTEQVPGVGNLPLLGALFRSKTDDTQREEVIILLSVHIVKDQEQYAQQSGALIENIERIRGGSRKGLMGHGRERLAQDHYQKALRKLEEGDTEKALWHTTLSLYCNPRFLPAMQIKEQIEHARAWDLDGSASRTLMYNLIAPQRGYRVPPFGRPGAPRSEPADNRGNEPNDE